MLKLLKRSNTDMKSLSLVANIYIGLTFQTLRCNQSVYIDSISIKNNKTSKL